MSIENISSIRILKLALITQEVDALRDVLREFDNINHIKIKNMHPYEFIVDFCKKKPALTGGKPKPEILQLLESKGAKIVFGLSVIKEDPDLEDRAEMEFKSYKKNVVELKLALDNLDITRVSEILERFDGDESIVINGMLVTNYFYAFHEEAEDTYNDDEYSKLEIIWEMLWKKTDPETWKEYLASENICTEQPKPVDSFPYDIISKPSETEEDFFNYSKNILTGECLVFC